MPKLTPLKAIRLKCLDCMCGQMKEVKLCPSKDCALWGFRRGKKPKAPSEQEDSKNPPEKPAEKQ